MKKIFSLFTAILFAGSMMATDPVAIYAETFGDNGSSNTVYSSASCYTAKTSMFTSGHQTSVVSNYSGDGKVGKNSVDVSNNEGASGLSAGWYTASSGTNTKTLFKVENINISGYSDLSLRFNLLRKNGAATTNYVTVTYSIDGAAAKTLSYTAPTDGNWTWCSGDLTGTGSSLSITFTMHTTGGFTHRIDDITLSGVVSTPIPTITCEPTSLAWGNQKQNIAVDPATKKFVLKGANLTKALTLAASTGYDVSPKEISAADANKAAGVEVTVTPTTPTAKGANNGTITISGDDLVDGDSNPKDSVLKITMNVIATYAITVPDITGGTLLWDPAKPDYAAQGEQFTLTATPSSGYEGGTIAIKNADDEDADITTTVLSGSTLTMPANAIKVIVSFSEKTCSPLGTPANVVVSGKAYPYDAVKLAWDAVTNADKYDISIKQGETEVESASDLTGTSFTLTKTLAANTTYSYEVVAKSNTPDTYCDSDPASDDFTTDELPKAKLSLSENGTLTVIEEEHTILTPFALPDATEEIAGKVFVGWDANPDCAAAPTYAKGGNYTFANTTAVTLYAVYATFVPGPVCYKLVSDLTLNTTEPKRYIFVSSNEEGDAYAIPAKDLGSAAHSINGVAVTIASADKTPAITSEKKNLEFIYTAGASGSQLTMVVAEDTGNQLVINGNGIGKQPAGKAFWTTSKGLNGTNSKGTTTYYVAMDAATTFDATESATGRVYAYEKIVGESSYSDYTTTGVKAPIATVDPTALNLSAAAAKDVITVTTENVDDTKLAVAIFDDETCETAFLGEWLSVSINGDKNIAYEAKAAASYVNTRTAYIRLTAPSTDPKVDPAVVVIPVEQAANPSRVFASLEELNSSDLPRTSSGTTVTVTFVNVEITSVSGKSVYVNIKDQESTDNDIQIYGPSNSTWTKGGKISATSISGTWKEYNDVMELQVSTWEGISYTAPTPTAVDNAEAEVKAVKFIENGQLFIEKNGHVYNVQGQIVK